MFPSDRRKVNAQMFVGSGVSGTSAVRGVAAATLTLYYRCLVSHQRGMDIPTEHPRTVNLGEGILLEATTAFLARPSMGRTG